MKNNLYKLLIEASQGTIIIDSIPWQVHFDTIIEEDGNIKLDTGNTAQLKLLIRDEKTFLELLSKYLDLEENLNRKTPRFINDTKEEQEKFRIMNLFVNATTTDFSDPISYLRRRIAFINDKTLSNLNKELDIPLSKNFLNSTLSIKEELTDSRMETPYKLSFSLKNKIDGKEVIYNLPSIYYGNYENTTYIYSIINDNKNTPSNKEEEKYIKKIKRLLYKVTPKIEEDKDYYDYKNGKSSYYPEGNLTDVTPSFVLVINIFSSILSHYNISKIKACPYLPIRYYSRDEAARLPINKDRIDKLRKRNQNIQTNLTNKFIRSFRRASHENNKIQIDSLPYEIDEYLNITLLPSKEKLDNILLEETNNIRK